MDINNYSYSNYSTSNKNNQVIANFINDNISVKVFKTKNWYGENAYVVDFYCYDDVTSYSKSFSIEENAMELYEYFTESCFSGEVDEDYVDFLSDRD